MALTFTGPFAYFLLACLFLGCLNWIVVLVNSVFAFYYRTREDAVKRRLKPSSSFRNLTPIAKDITWFFGLMSKDLRTSLFQEYTLDEQMSSKEKNSVRVLSIFQFIIYCVVGVGLILCLLGVGLNTRFLGITRS